MKIKEFLEKIWKYAGKKAVKSRSVWEGAVIISFVMGVLGSSYYFTETEEVAGAGANPRDQVAIGRLAQKAAKSGDYLLAEKMYAKLKVLGAESDGQLEYLIYPERYLKTHIRKYKELLKKFPESRDIMLQLSILYAQDGDKQRARLFYEQARILDPNGETVKEVGAILF